MNRPHLSALTAFFLLFFLAGTAQAQDTFVPPSGKTLLIAGQDRNTIARYVSTTGEVPGGVMVYTSIQKLDGLDSAADYGSGPQDAKALLKAYPHSVLQIGLYMVGALEDIVTGKYDDNIHKLAMWLKRANRPVYLRIGYEFDNPENLYQPQEYIDAFRYIVDALRKEGVRNTAYVWHYWDTGYVQRPGWPGLNLNSNEDLWMNWYPGDDYVDWFGVSIFETNQIPEASKFLAAARAHHKPFMIAESSPFGLYIPESKRLWFKHIFQFIEENNVEAFCYIDSDWDQLPMFRDKNWGDARIDKDRTLKEFWLQKTGEERYLKASKDLFAELGWT